MFQESRPFGGGNYLTTLEHQSQTGYKIPTGTDNLLVRHIHDGGRPEGRVYCGDTSRNYAARLRWQPDGAFTATAYISVARIDPRTPVHLSLRIDSRVIRMGPYRIVGDTTIDGIEIEPLSRFR